MEKKSNSRIAETMMQKYCNQYVMVICYEGTYYGTLTNYDMLFVCIENGVKLSGNEIIYGKTFYITRRQMLSISLSSTNYFHDRDPNDADRRVPLKYPYVIDEDSNEFPISEKITSDAVQIKTEPSQFKRLLDTIEETEKFKTQIAQNSAQMSQYFTNFSDYITPNNIATQIPRTVDEVAPISQSKTHTFDSKAKVLDNSRVVGFFITEDPQDSSAMSEYPEYNAQSLKRIAELPQGGTRMSKNGGNILDDWVGLSQYMRQLGCYGQTPEYKAKTLNKMAEYSQGGTGMWKNRGNILENSAEFLQYKRQLSEYSEQTPEYKAQTLNKMAEHLQSGTPMLENRGNILDDSVEFSQYIRQLGCCREIPEYETQTLKYSGKTHDSMAEFPQDGTRLPEYSGQTQEYKAHTLKDRRPAQEYNPQFSKYMAQSSVGGLKTPTYRPQIPEYKIHTSEFQAQAPEYRVETLNEMGQIPQMSEYMTQMSEYSTEYMTPVQKLAAALLDLTSECELQNQRTLYRKAKDTSDMLGDWKLNMEMWLNSNVDSTE